MKSDPTSTTPPHTALDELYYQQAIAADAEVLASAPHPWRIEEPNKHYFRIVDATGKPVCDFFPEATWTRGREATLDIAHRIVRLANSAVLRGQEP